MKIIIVGCSHAGLIASKETLKFHPETDVTIYERTTNIAFEAGGIPLYLSNEVDHLEQMVASMPDELEALGAHVKLNHDVLKIDQKTKTMVVEDLTTHEQFEDSYDKLVFTPGSRATLPPVKGIDSFRVQVCKTVAQAELIKRYAQNNHHIAIVGGGYSGVEIAEAFAHTDHQVTLIQDGAQLLK